MPPKPPPQRALSPHQARKLKRYRILIIAAMASLVVIATWIFVVRSIPEMPVQPPGYVEPTRAEMDCIANIVEGNSAGSGNVSALIEDCQQR